MFSYLRSNVWSALPAVAGIVVLLLAHTISHDINVISCQRDQAVGYNWLVCGDANTETMKLFMGRLDVPDAHEAAQSMSVPTQSAAQEGKSRLAWIASSGVLIVVAIAAFGASLFLAYDGLAGHARAVERSISPAKGLPMLTAMVVVASLITALIWQAYLTWQFGLWDSRWREVDLSWAWQFVVDPDAALPSDGLTNWWLLIPSVSQVHHISAVWAALAVFALMALITGTLHQGPADPDFRRNPRAGSSLDDSENIAYRRYLGRSFARLRYAIYIGAMLLAAVVAETAARYAWPASLASDTSLASALAGLGQQYAMVTGLYFSLLLAAMYYPALTTLRNRGRDYFRARKPEATLAEQEKWLDEENLSFKFSSNWSEFIALLAPAAAGLLPHLTTGS